MLVCSIVNLRAFVRGAYDAIEGPSISSIGSRLKIVVEETVARATACPARRQDTRDPRLEVLSSIFALAGVLSCARRAQVSPEDGIHLPNSVWTEFIPGTTFVPRAVGP